MTSPIFFKSSIAVANCLVIVSSCIQNHFQKYRYCQIFLLMSDLGLVAYCYYFFSRSVSATEQKLHVAARRLCQYNEIATLNLFFPRTVITI